MSRLPSVVPGALIRAAARSDVRDILVFLGTSNPTRALKFAQSFTQTLEQLVSMPALGSPRELEDARLRGLRVWPVGDFKAYLVFYKPILAGSVATTTNGIEVVRVLHHSRDVETHLSDDATFAES